MKTLETIRKGEEEFEDEFVYKGKEGRYLIEEFRSDKVPKELQDFNKQNLTNILTSLKEEIEEKRLEVTLHPDQLGFAETKGYNKALHDVQDLLDSILKEI